MVSHSALSLFAVLRVAASAQAMVAFSTLLTCVGFFRLTPKTGNPQRFAALRSRARNATAGLHRASFRNPFDAAK
jgi:hypothetical protein